MQRNSKILSYSTGLLLVGSGALGDLLSGFFALDHHLSFGLLAHLVSVLTWAIGLLLLDRPDALLSTMLGSLLFPGIGISTWLLAGAISNIFRNKNRATDEEDENQVDLTAEIHTAIEMPFETSLRPIVEVLKVSDSRTKRAALDLICREAPLNSLSLARGFLSDPEPDVRALAAVALSHLESRMSEQVKSALGQVEMEPMSAESHAALGYVCLKSADQIRNDSMNRHFYLTRARQALEKAIRLDATRVDARIALMESLIGLRECPKAWDLLAEVLLARPHESRVYQLGLEIAFRERRFDRVVMLAKQASQALPENDVAFAVIRWWLAFDTAGPRAGYGA